jgi:hypothetical protein
MKEVTYSTLSNSVLRIATRQCQFQLKEVNFLTAYNYKIDPEFNPMKRLNFLRKHTGLLDKYDIKIQ